MTTDPNIKCHIDNLPHLCIKKEEFFGFHAYIEQSHVHRYKLDVHSKSGAVIKCEYTERKVWEEVLKKMDKETTL
jgi:hypothetical protein